MALRRAGLGLGQIAVLLAERDPDPAATLRTHLAQLEEDLRRRGELRNRIAAALATLSAVPEAPVRSGFRSARAHAAPESGRAETHSPWRALCTPDSCGEQLHLTPGAGRHWAMTGRHPSIGQSEVTVSVIVIEFVTLGGIVSDPDGSGGTPE